MAFDCRAARAALAWLHRHVDKGGDGYEENAHYEKYTLALAVLDRLVKP